MQNVQEVTPQMVFVSFSIIALLLLFLGTGVENFGAIEWIALVLAIIGLLSNGFIIYAKTRKTEKK